MTIRCPMCNQEVDALRARAVAIWGGRTFYFCTPEHKAAFAGDPAAQQRARSGVVGAPATGPMSGPMSGAAARDRSAPVVAVQHPQRSAPIPIAQPAVPSAGVPAPPLGLPPPGPDEQVITIEAPPEGEVGRGRAALWAGLAIALVILVVIVVLVLRK